MTRALLVRARNTPRQLEGFKRPVEARKKIVRLDFWAHSYAGYAARCGTSLPQKQFNQPRSSSCAHDILRCSQATTFDSWIRLDEETTFRSRCASMLRLEATVSSVMGKDAARSRHLKLDQAKYPTRHTRRARAAFAVCLQASKFDSCLCPLFAFVRAVSVNTAHRSLRRQPSAKSLIQKKSFGARFRNKKKRHRGVVQEQNACLRVRCERQPTCTSCYHIQMPYKDRDRQNAYQRARLAKRRCEWLRAHGPCKECGTWENLEVDHVDSHKKLSHKVWSWSKKRQETELKKCCVLCTSCHVRKTTLNGERPRGVRHGQAKLTPKLVRAIRNSEESCAAIARKLQMHRSTIWEVRTKKIWNHI